MPHSSTYTLSRLRQRVQLTVKSCRLESVNAGGPRFETDSGTMLVGAAEGCDVRLDDAAVSRRHCEIRHAEGQWLIRDLESRNGTFIDGRRIKEAYLTDGARLRVGQTTLRFTTKDSTVEVAPDDGAGLAGMIGKSAAMRQLYGLIRKVGPSRLSVLIHGETGSGKERVARALHQLSGRKGPLQVLDCAALPPELAESELFGHVEGAFTGATGTRAGAFERADGGTLFLDEIGELPLALQPKLLRVLEQRELQRVGSNDTVSVDVRVVSATHKDLEAQAKAGEFRQDLFFRLAGVVLELPALRERLDDLPLLAEATLGDRTLSAAALKELKAHPWPGNVRELINVLSHAMALAKGDVIEADDLPLRAVGRLRRAQLEVNDHLSYRASRDQVLEAFNRAYVERLVDRVSGDLAKAAEQSGLHKKSVERMLRRYGIRRQNR